MKLHYQSTRGMSREEWLLCRRKGIGGSDAAAIAGLNPYASPYSVWADKTGRLNEGEYNEAMRIGRDLEYYVARRFMERMDKRCYRRNAIITNDKYPFALANVDRMVTKERAGLECKTTSVLNLKKFFGGEYPESYYMQCVHYMAVTGADRWYLAVLVLNKGLFIYTIEREEAQIQALMEAEARFWQHVQNDTPPPVDGTAPTDEALKQVFKAEVQERGNPIELVGRQPVIAELIAVKASIQKLETTQRLLEQTLKAEMGNAQYGVCGSYKLLWKEQQRSAFDVNAFTTANPDIDLSGFYKTTAFRKFEIKGMA